MKKPVPDEIIYRGIIGDAVRLIDPHTEADPAAVFASGLTYFSQAVGPRPYVKQGGLKHPLILWALIVGNSSKGKKGESRRSIHSLFRQAFEEYFEDDDSPFMMDGIPQSGATLVRTLAEQQEIATEELCVWDRPDGFPVLAFDEEWATVMQATKKDKPLATYLRKLWEGKNKISHRISQNGKTVRATIDKPHMCILGHITPEEMRLTLGQADIAGGTINRFLCFASEKSKKLPFGGGLDEKEQAKFALRLRRFIERGQRVAAVEMTAEAAKYWVQLYDELDAMMEQGQEMEKWIGRAHPQVLRIAGLYALTTHEGVDPPKVTVDNFKSAMALLRYSIESVKYAMGDIGGNKRGQIAAKILDLLSEGPINSADLNKGLGGRTPKTVIRAAMVELRGRAFVYNNPKPSGGRRGFMYCLADDLPEGVEVLSYDDVEDEPGGPVYEGEVVKDTGLTVKVRPSRTREPEPPQEPARGPLKVIMGAVEPKPKPKPDSPFGALDGLI
ncbi:DUF3987 domain-containing protein [Nonomuraea recticatena]